MKRENPLAKTRQFRVQIDPELARIAYLSGNFALYRIWVYATRAIGDGCGWVEKKSLMTGLRRRNIKMTARSLNRHIKAGTGVFWTYDASTKRLYLIGAEKLTAHLSAQCENGDLQTNQPGVRRMKADLSGSIGDAIASTYAAWIARKDKGEGVTISREVLSILWGVSVPTLLQWESKASVQKKANYAQQRDTNPERVPAHAYLCRAKSGEDFVSWRLPNTYVADVAEHSKNGNARKIRHSVRGFSRQPAVLGVGGLQPSGKLYFADHSNKRKKSDGFQNCSIHLKKHQDIFVPHYVALGAKREHLIHERYDIEYNASVTNLTMRDYAAAYDPAFRRRAALFNMVLAGKRKMPRLKA